MIAVELENLRYAYPNGTIALDGISLTVDADEHVALIGANGAGKSTLLLHLNGLLHNDGIVRIMDMPVEPRTLKTIRQQVGVVFQNPDDQLFCPTVYDDVAFGPRNMGLSEDDVRQRVLSALDTVGMGTLRDRSPYHLSLGQKKRVAIATVLAASPTLLVFDEPTSNLDPRGQRELAALFLQLDQTLIVATHDLQFARHVCSRVILLDQGQIAADGPTEKILNDQPLLEAHNL